MRLFFALIIFLFFSVYCEKNPLTTSEKITINDNQVICENCIYVSPNGSGDKSGKTIDNAADKSQLTTLLFSLTAGDTLFLGGGTYTNAFTISKSGNINNRINIVGYEINGSLPRFVGQWDMSNPGSSNGSYAAITVGKNVNHLMIKNIQCEGWIYGVRTGDGYCKDLLIDNVDTYSCREGIYLENVSEAVIKYCEFVKYTKRGIRINGNVNDVHISDCVADGTNGDNSWICEAYPFGFMIEEKDGNHDITYHRCIAKNNYHEREADKYWNGDGFTTENTAYRVAYYDCESYDNTDAGWDDKSKAPYMQGCIGFRNKRNFRFWNIGGSASEPAIMQNCISGYAKKKGGNYSSDGVWTSGWLNIENSTIHNSTNSTIAIEAESQIEVNVTNTILSVNTDIVNGYKESNLYHIENGKINLTNSEIWIKNITGENPQYVKDFRNWINSPKDCFNSQTFGPDIGYYVE